MQSKFFGVIMSKLTIRKHSTKTETQRAARTTRTANACSWGTQQEDKNTMSGNSNQGIERNIVHIQVSDV
jgi:hypothetical protein